MIIKVTGSMSPMPIRIVVSGSTQPSINVGGSSSATPITVVVSGTTQPAVNVSVPNFVTFANRADKANYADVALFAITTAGVVDVASSSLYAETASLAYTSSHAYTADTASYVIGVSAADFNTLLNKPVLVSSSAQINTGSFSGLFNGALIGSASYALTASYVLNGGVTVTGSSDFNTLINKPTLVSSSAQINYNLIQNTPSASNGTASYVDYSNVANIPTLVSSSAQASQWSVLSSSYAATAAYAANASAADFNTLLNKPVLISSSAQISYLGIVNVPTGIISSSAQLNSLVHSSSYAETASYALNVPAGDFNTLLNKPTLISSSVQINSGSFTGSFIGSHTGSLLGSASFSSTSSVSISGSYSLTASYALTTGGTISNAISSSYALSASWAPTSAGGDFNTLVNKPTLVSSSVQINTGSFTGSFVGSLVGSASYAPTILPLGTVSSSAQVSYTGLSNIPVGILSSSTQFNALANTSASYAANASAADFNTLLNKPELVSSSAQVNSGSFTGSFTGSLLGSTSFATTASAATSITFTPISASYAGTDFNAINNKPALVSSSAQISYGSITEVPSGIISSSAQVAANLPLGTISSSAQINSGSFTGSFVGSASYASNSLSASYAPLILPLGVVSSSAQVSYTSITNVPVGILSSSAQFNALTNTSASYSITASYALTSAGTVTNAVTASYLSGTINFPNGLVVTGSVTASAFSGSGTQIVGVISSSYALSASWAPTAAAVAADFNTLLNKPTLVSSSAQVNSGSFTGSFTGSLLGSASYAPTILPLGTLSSSVQINSGSFTGSFTGSLLGSASFATTASAATSITFTPVSATYAGTDFNAINNKPTLVSASVQITYGTLTGIPVGIISSSAQVVANLPLGTVSSSTQINSGSFTGSFTGSLLGSASYAPTILPLGTVSSSGQVSYTGLSNIPVGILSSSIQFNALSNTSASFATTASAATSITFTPVSATYAGTDFGAINNKPSLVSASAQINYTGLSNIPVSILSSSTQFNALSNTSASYAPTILPLGTVSSSAQINTGSFTGSFIGSHTGSFTGSFVGNIIGSASFATTASAATSITFTPVSATYAGTDFNAINNKPALVSSSAQISYTNITNVPLGILSSSTQFNALTNTSASYALSGSYALTASYAANVSSADFNTLLNKPTLVSSSAQVNSGSFTGSFTGSLLGSSSFATTASAATSITFTPVSATYAGTDFNAINNKPSLVSSSVQINTGSFTGSFIGSHTGSFTGSFVGSLIGSASFATTASAATSITFTPVSATYAGTDFNAINNKPVLVSSSAQITYGSITGISVGIISSSVQVVASLPVGTVSSSVQVNSGSFTGSFTGSLLGSASFATTASAATSITFTPVSATYAGTDFNAINNKPALVSSSAQISYTSITNVPVGILSSSTQFNALSNTSASYAPTILPLGTVSSSVQINSGSFTGSFTGSLLGSASYAPTILPIGTVSSSAQVSYSGLSNIPVGILSSSAQFNALTNTSASYALTASYATTDFNAINNKPSLVSSSAQVNTGSFTGSFVGMHTGFFSGSSVTASLGASFYSASYILAEGTGSIPAESTMLQIVASSSMPARVSLDSHVILNSGSSLRGRRSRGTVTNPTVVQSGDTLLQVAGDGYDGTTYSAGQLSILLQTAENWSSTNKGTKINFRVTPAGSTVASSSLVLYGDSVQVPVPLIAASSVSASAFSGSGVQITGIISSSYSLSGSCAWSASFATTASAATSITFVPVSASYAATDFGAINNKPALVSSSAQISYTGLANIPVGILSSSTQFNALSNTSASYALSGSYALSASWSPSAAGGDFNTLTNKPTLVSSSAQVNSGSFTGSFIGSASFATNASTASYATGTITFPSGLIVTGSVTASAFTGSGVAIIGVVSSSYAVTSSTTVLASNQVLAPISGTFGRSSLFVPGLINATSLTTIVASVSTIRIWPFIAPGVGTGSVKSLSLLATANGTIAVTASVAIYTNKPGDLYPDSLVTSSRIPIPTNALQTVILPTPTTLIAGQMYWVGFNIGSGSTLRGIAVASQYAMGVTALGTAVDTHYTSGSIWGLGASFVPAWPNSLTGSNLTVGTNATILPSVGLAFQ